MALRGFLSEIAGVGVYVDDVLLVFCENGLNTPWKLSKSMEKGGESPALDLPEEKIELMARALRAAVLVQPPNKKRKTLGPLDAEPRIGIKRVQVKEECESIEDSQDDEVPDLVD